MHQSLVEGPKVLDLNTKSFLRYWPFFVKTWPTFGDGFLAFVTIPFRMTR